MLQRVAELEHEKYTLNSRLALLEEVTRHAAAVSESHTHERNPGCYLDFRKCSARTMTASLTLRYVWLPE